MVAPGFIDLHQHGQDDENYRYAALDGVTTALEMEVGTGDVDAWYRQHGPSRLINFGVSIGHIPVRMKVMGDSGNLLPSGPGANKIATAAQVNEMVRMINAGFDAGALGLGLGPAYTPAASNWEVLEMFRVAGRHHASAHIHVREGPIGDPEGNAPGIEEAVAAALSTGTPLHIVHVNSVSYFAVGRTLALLRGARAHGLDVTWEAYPYSASMTEIESALFDDWGDRPDSDYQKLEWPPTGERLTRASFQAKRKEGGIVIIHDNTDANDAIAVGDSLTMIASDGFMHQGKGHPRATGTYARVLGHFVREANAFSLSAAIRKMSLMPAQRLQEAGASVRAKGSGQSRRRCRPHHLRSGPGDRPIHVQGAGTSARGDRTRAGEWLPRGERREDRSQRRSRAPHEERQKPGVAATSRRHTPCNVAGRPDGFDCGRLSGESWAEAALGSPRPRACYPTRCL